MPPRPRPLLSVIIPTYNRAHFLPRAIDSALGSAPDGNVEVIVVPNGSDVSWKVIAESYRSDPKVRWHPIKTGHANIARNVGMREATGTYIRFLDDDDYLYPSSASEQLIRLVECGADLSFGDIDFVDEINQSKKVLKQIETDDYYVSLLSPIHSKQPTSLVYLRSALFGSEWDPSIDRNQDVYWMMSLCESKELRTVRFSKTVGAWVQHALPRTSTAHDPWTVSKETAERVLQLTRMLERRGTLTQARAQAAADSLWRCLHNGAMYDPFYWIDVAKQARTLACGRTPGTPLYNINFVSAFDPLIVEFLIIPWRWIKAITRKFL